jgi:hypothetical protein
MTNAKNLITPPVYCDAHGMFIFDGRDEMICEIRGGKRIKKLINREEAYKVIGDFIADSINEKLNQKLGETRKPETPREAETLSTIIKTRLSYIDETLIDREARKEKLSIERTVFKRAVNWVLDEISRINRREDAHR